MKYWNKTRAMKGDWPIRAKEYLGQAGVLALKCPILGGTASQMRHFGREE
jgi:hypothetical protein